MITPSIAYEYQDEPTIQSYELDQYDSIDALGRINRAVLSVENKLQTKRDGESVDLARLIISTDYALKQDDVLPSSFNNVKFDLELQPYEWLGFYFDATHDPQNHDFKEGNFDLYVNNPTDRWFFRIGERYRYKVDNQLETEVGWKINPKWQFRFNQIFELDTGKNERQEIFFRRDLHAWLFDIVFSNQKDDGQEIMFVFSMKGFDDVRLEGGRSFASGSERPGAN